MNIPALEANVEEIDRQIARLERELEAKRLERRLTENDIAAARLQAWYAANPGIELRVGDKLVGRDGREYVIEEHYLHSYDDEPEVIAADEDGYGEEFNIDTARRMRETWLRQEAWKANYRPEFPSAYDFIDEEAQS